MADDVTDATFEEGAEEPLRLLAVDADDLKVLAALVQDAVFPASEMRWLPRRRQFAVLVNRFRWEDRDNAERQHRPYERVQTLLVVDSVLKVRSSGFDHGDRDLVLSLLDITFTVTDPPAGTVEMVLAGDGAIRLEVEALEVLLKDVTRPYVAPSHKAPQHPLDD